MNLAGESIFGRRWTAAQKARIRDSRVETTRRLVAAMRRASPADARPKVLRLGVGGRVLRAARRPGARRGRALSGQDFLAEVCREWEKAALEAEALGVRVVLVRTGIVLGPGGGALAQMLPIFRLGIGGPIGSGQAVHVLDPPRRPRRR